MRAAFGLLLLAACGGEAATHSASLGSSASAPACDTDAGLTVPDGFCVTLFADSVPGARHLAVAPNGDVFAAVNTGDGESGGAASGGVVGLRDETGDGHADRREVFGGRGGTGIALTGNWLYADAGTAIVRYRLPAGALRPVGDPDTIVRDLPTGGHGARNIAFDAEGTLWVNIGSRTNSCQVADRTSQSAGAEPCNELRTRAGIWRFAPNRLRQTQASGQRVATGIRNAMGLALNPVDWKMFATQHGRDQLLQNWPGLYDAARSAELPAEELVQVTPGDDFGWPYCYYDQFRRALVQAPEYGGNGTDLGRCARAKAPEVAFPGHWAPMALAFYAGDAFPQRYHGGAFVAFHGSWNRAPLPQQGFRVAFVPFRQGVAADTFETFATVTSESHRPAGLAVGQDGALYVSDDAGGRIWRVAYRGE